jgi:hypothetical protein
MASLKSNIVKRIDRLPKPRRAAEAMIPLFEAVSNSIHSVQEKYKIKVQQKGAISVAIELPKANRELKIVVSDNGQKSASVVKVLEDYFGLTASKK